MALDPITAVADAIAEVAKVIGQIMATKKVRYMKAALDAAERYIHINEGFGENAQLSAEEKKKLLKKFRTRFFKYN